jgi:hypothetical protein
VELYHLHFHFPEWKFNLDKRVVCFKEKSRISTPDTGKLHGLAERMTEAASGNLQVQSELYDFYNIFAFVNSLSNLDNCLIIWVFYFLWVVQLTF